MQGSDAGNFSGDLAPNNVVAVGVSQFRTILSIIQAESTNSGLYQCIATSELDSEVIMAYVDIIVL